MFLYDPNVLKDPAREAERIEKCLGIQWDLISDCVSAVPRYNIYGSLRGRTLGPDLSEMSEDEVMKVAISRL